MSTKWVGANSNNYETGRRGNTIKKIILHWIVGTLESADATFQNPQRQASAHYGIGDEEVHQYVKEEDTAYHAGNFATNLVSIGIEHEGGWETSPGNRVKPSQKTHETSARLVADIAKRYNIPLDRDHIRLHKEVSDSPTACPGSLDIDLIIKLAKGQITSTPLRDLVIDYDDQEGKRHTIGWYVYEWFIEKKQATELRGQNKNLIEELKDHEKECEARLEEVKKANDETMAKLKEDQEFELLKITKDYEIQIQLKDEKITELKEEIDNHVDPQIEVDAKCAKLMAYELNFGEISIAFMKCLDRNIRYLLSKLPKKNP